MMPKLTIRKWITELTSSLFVLLFLYTAINKLRNPGAFAGAMQHSALLSPYATFLSLFVPVTEIIIAIILIIPGTRKKGILASAILMIIFTCYVGYMLVAKSDLPCTCGGIIQQMNWQDHFWFNSFLTILSIISWFLYPKRLVAISRRSRTPVEYSRQTVNN